jgi:hypothetical protein
VDAIATAVPAGVGWTTSYMSSRLVRFGPSNLQPDYDDPYVVGSSFVAPMPKGTKITTATCRGLGPRRAGRYRAFSCEAQWVDPGDTSHRSGRATLWTQLSYAALPAGNHYTDPNGGYTVCASDTSLGKCPPQPPSHPLPNDPRLYKGILGTGPRGAARDLTVAEIAKRRGVSVNLARSTLVNFGCIPASTSTWLGYRCGFQSADFSSSTVTWSPGKTGWTAVVTLAP